MSNYFFILLALFGLCYGSFLNVLITRTLTSESIIYPPSKCPKCNHLLYWWQNIPLLSYILLKGKCYFCNKVISIRYPIVEILGLLIFLFAFINNVSVVDAISVIFIVSMFLVISFTDVAERKVSLVQALIIILAGIFFNRYDVLNSLFGCISASGFIFLLSIIGKKFSDNDILGKGDIFLAGALGAVTGFDSLFLFLLYVLIIQFFLVLPSYIVHLIRSENLETLRFLILFFVACLFLYVFRNISFNGSKLIFIVLLFLLSYLACRLVFQIIKTFNEAESHSYTPLAPAFFISCLMFLI